MCPDCGEGYARLAMHWFGPCSPPPLSTGVTDLLSGLLLDDGFVGGNGPNKHFQFSTRWRPFAAWLFDELSWLASRVTRADHPGRPEPNQQYVVRTYAHPDLTQFRAWYADGEGTGSGDHRLPMPDDLPAGLLTPRVGRAWYAASGSVAWSDPAYTTTRQVSFSAAADERAACVTALLESVGLEPTRAGRRVQLSPKQTSAWLEWIGDPMPGVDYKWAVDAEEYREAKRDAEAWRAWLFHRPNEDEALGIDSFSGE